MKSVGRWSLCRGLEPLLTPSPPSHSQGWVLGYALLCPASPSAPLPSNCLHTPAPWQGSRCRNGEGHPHCQSLGAECGGDPPARDWRLLAKVPPLAASQRPQAGGDEPFSHSQSGYLELSNSEVSIPWGSLIHCGLGYHAYRKKKCLPELPQGAPPAEAQCIGPAAGVSKCMCVLSRGMGTQDTCEGPLSPGSRRSTPSACFMLDEPSPPPPSLPGSDSRCLRSILRSLCH